MLVEAAVVGAVLAAVGQLYELDVHWKLFVAGVLIHIGFEMLGFNKWYCKHGAACK